VRLALIGETLIHKFIYPGHLNGFDRKLMIEQGGWMADMHDSGDGLPYDEAVRIVAIASPDPSARAIAATCGVEHYFTAVEQLPPDLVDGVLILENDGAKHLDMALPYLRRGQFVYIDKPVALSLSDVVKMQQAALESGATVLAGSALRYSPKVQEAAAYMRTKRPSGVVIVGPGTWYDYACHTVETLVALFGPDVVRHQQLGTAEAGQVILEWADGMLATVLFGAHFQPLFRIQAYFSDEAREWVIDDARAYYSGLSHAIVRAVKGEEKPQPWEDALAITRILEDVGKLYS